MPSHAASATELLAVVTRPEYHFLSPTKSAEILITVTLNQQEIYDTYSFGVNRRARSWNKRE